MLKKENRLSNLRLKAKSRVLDSSLFKIKIFSTGSLVTKFAFVVSKKIDKRAVARNETKRVLKKAVKEILERIISGTDIIVFAKTKIEFEQKENVKKELEQVLEKAKLIK